ncbi:hypothetical protein LZ198_02735 [Myxococcus sp. K15C18031901]|uniref:hypothetical protein n=1 Tax=Myxococcus dinghuensis TaxID=2906761 RepID=UPI0020A7378B|nr:hypothetical protein [Myxococcus dinghuensis]MCP3097785.1 hypothetical protein [Myxococcus dinghuensis]
MASLSWHSTVGITATLALCACGGPDESARYLLDFGYGSDTIRVTPDDLVEFAPNAFVSLDRQFFTVETLTFRLADLRMDLPPEVRCEDYDDEVLSPELSCNDAVRRPGSFPLEPAPEDLPGVLLLPGPVELGTDKRLSVGGKQVFIPRIYYPAIDTRWVPGTPEQPSFHLRARFTYEGKPLVLEFAFQSDEPMRFEHRGVSTGLPRQFSEHPAAFGGTLDMNHWLTGTNISGCLAAGDLTLDGDVLRLETGRGACAEAATNMRLSIQQSGNLFTGLRL